MDQDYLKLAVHSSLVKAHDNSNVTRQFETMRRSRTPSPDTVKPLVDKRRGCRDLGQSPIGGEEEEVAMTYREKSGFHLSHVSRGAQKLTRTIEFLSNAPRLDQTAEYIAEDLMRGALDLQESLVIFSKLQEASKVMSERRRKPRLDSREEREEYADVFDPEAMGFRRFMTGGLQNKSQEPRLLINGSSSNCLKPKDLIRDSLHQQNILRVSSDDENASSSQYLKFAASYRVEDPKNEHKKAKCPNLIAKMMGLEKEILGTVQCIKKEEKKKKTSQARPDFDTVVPQTMKIELMEQNTDRKEKSLQVINEAMHFKELQKSGQVVDETLCFFDTLRSEQFRRNAHKDYDFPPIVLMKPLHLPCWQRGEVQKDLLSSKTSMQGEFHSVKLVRENKVSDHGLMQPKASERKERKKMDKTIVESFRKNNTSTAELHKKQKNDGIRTCKTTNVAHKPPLKGKQQEKRVAKATRVRQTKPISARQTKPERKWSVTKSDISNQRSTTPVPKLKCSVRPVSQNSVISTREQKTSGVKSVRKSTLKKAVNKTEKMGDGKGSVPLSTIHCVSTTILYDDDLPRHAVQGEKPSNKDVVGEDQKRFHEVMQKTKIHGKLYPNSILPVNKAVGQVIKSESVEAAVCLLDKTAIIRKSSGTEVDMKQLFLSSQSFLKLAQKHFGLDAHQPIYCRRKGLGEVVTGNAKLFLDCGKEMLKHKGHQRELSKHPLMSGHVRGLGQTLYSTLDQLVEEISNGIQKLISYIAVDYDAPAGNGLYNRLERDLRCKEMSLNIMWDLGWRNQTCIEESDQIFREVEEHVLSFLVEEIVKDLVY